MDQRQTNRDLDFLFSCLYDAFFPRIYVRRKALFLSVTVSLTIYFHANLRL